MSKCQLAILILIFLLSYQPKYNNCKLERNDENNQFCDNYENFFSIITLFAIVLSAFIERCNLKTCLIGLLAIYAVVAVFIMTISHYLILTMLEQTIVVISMVMRNLALITILDLSSLRQKSVVIVLFRALDILSVQIPSVIHQFSHTNGLSFKVVVSLFDFATSLYLSQMILKKFHKEEYEPVAADEKEQKQHSQSRTVLNSMHAFFDSIPKFTLCILLVIWVACSPITSILTANDVAYFQSNELNKMGVIWIATEILAAISFILITWKFVLRTVLISTMFAFTVAVAALGFVPIPLSGDAQGSGTVIVPGFHKYLFHVVQLPATMLIMTCVLIIATNVQAAMRCSVLTAFSASFHAFWPIFNFSMKNLLGSLYFELGRYPPTFSMLNDRDAIAGARPFLLFSIATIIILIATLFVRFEPQLAGEWEEKSKVPKDSKKKKNSALPCI